MFNQQALYENILFQSTGKQAKLKQVRLIAGGNLNQGIFIESSVGKYFLKLNFHPERDILEKEAEGLSALSARSPLKTPDIIGVGHIEDQNYLLLEYLPSNQSVSKTYWQKLGLGLAELHMNTQSNFGLESDNYISSLRQINPSVPDWGPFFIQARLEPLAGKAYYQGLISLDFYKRFQKLYPILETYFPKEKPAFLHGDLWSGNIMVGNDEEPVLIDPAVYFGHREMDLAFSRMFGGFSEDFYQAYETVFPLDPGFLERVPVYNLYPYWVHVLLFGTGYLSGISKTMDRLLD